MIFWNYFLFIIYIFILVLFCILYEQNGDKIVVYVFFLVIEFEDLEKLKNWIKQGTTLKFSIQWFDFR